MRAILFLHLPGCQGPSQGKCRAHPYMPAVAQHPTSHIPTTVLYLHQSCKGSTHSFRQQQNLAPTASGIQQDSLTAGREDPRGPRAAPGMHAKEHHPPQQGLWGGRLQSRKGRQPLQLSRLSGRKRRCPSWQARAWQLLGQAAGRCAAAHLSLAPHPQLPGPA